MGKRDPRVDAYIAKSAEFARPILTHLRRVVHGACPGVEETMKWSTPHFTHRGMLCFMAAFKQHCAFGFWKHALVVTERDANARSSRGAFGRIESREDLPPDATIVRYVKKAAQLNEDGVKAPTRTRKEPARPVVVPKDLRAALATNPEALAAFQAQSPSHRREYVEWIEEAKKAPTRERRLAKTLAQLAQGKALHWKYERKEARS